MINSDQFRAAQQQRQDALLALAADRPAHLQYIRALLSESEAADADLLDVPLPRGVSGRVAEAILDDVFWVLQEPPTMGFPAQYPNSYSRRRQVDALGAAKQARCRDSLESLLRVDDR